MTNLIINPGQHKGTERDITVRNRSESASQILATIWASNKAPATKRKYAEALERYLETGQDVHDAGALANYAQTLPSNSARLHLRAGIKLWTEKQAKVLKGTVTPETAVSVQAMLWRLESLVEAIPTNADKGETVHVWLTKPEQEWLLSLPNRQRHKGQRDNILLRLMLGAGLRRQEAASLRFDQIKQIGAVPVLQIHGKGNKNRIVPIGTNLGNLLDWWRLKVGGGGPILRSVNKGGKIGERKLNDASIFRIVNQYGGQIDKPTLAPHDLRRTFAENIRRNGVDIASISKLLGHESVETTMRYLNHRVDTTIVPADFLPW